MPKNQADAFALLRRLKSADADRAWEDFVESYGSLLLQVVQLFSQDADAKRDCFIFVCEQLSAHHFRRLQKYGSRDKASFSTWLRCVTRNLCIDWQRSLSGRRRPFKVIQGLPLLEQEVYRLHFLQRLTLEETFQVIRQSFPEVSTKHVSEIRDKIYSFLSPRQLWLLSSRTPVPLETLDVAERQSGYREVQDQGANPEEQLLDKEKRAQLSLGLAQLTSQDRLLLQMRFEEGASLQVCAETLGLQNPQKVHRMISSVLSRLRAWLPD